MPRRVNRCLNPVVGSTFGLVGTHNSGGGAATNRGVDATFGRTAGSSFKVTWSAAALGGWCYVNWGETSGTNPTVNPGDKMTMTMWVYATHADIGAYPCVQFCNAGYSQIASYDGATVYGMNDGQWHKLTVDVTAPAGAVYARLQVDLPVQSAGPAGSSAWVTDLLFAPTAQGGSFGYGATPGWRWMGPAHQSASQEMRGAPTGLLLPT